MARTSLATTLVHLTTDIFVTYDVAAGRKARAGGWISASDLGGGAIGAGLAIIVAEAGLPRWCPAAMIAAICAAALPYILLPAWRPAAGAAGKPITGLRALGRDVGDMVRSPKGAAALLLVVLPIGSIGMLSLVPVIAPDWHAGARSVAFVAGMGGGLVQIAGAMVGGVLADRTDRKRAYFIVGLAIAAILTGMALGPQIPSADIVFALLYLAALGAFFAAFVAVEFETVGGGGAAATKCMLLGCVSNGSSDLMTPSTTESTTATASPSCCWWKRHWGSPRSGCLHLHAPSCDGSVAFAYGPTVWPRRHDTTDRNGLILRDARSGRLFGEPVAGVAEGSGTASSALAPMVSLTGRTT